MQVLFGVLNSLADCVGNLARLAKPKADRAVAVADNHEGCELKDTTALHRFGNAVDRNNSFLQFEIRCIYQSQKYPSFFRI